jgi:hypothetical protein
MAGLERQYESKYHFQLKALSKAKSEAQKFAEVRQEIKLRDISPKQQGGWCARRFSIVLTT